MLKLLRRFVYTRTAYFFSRRARVETTSARINVAHEGRKGKRAGTQGEEQEGEGEQEEEVEEQKSERAGGALAWYLRRHFLADCQ